MYDIPMPLNRERRLPTLYDVRQEDIPEMITMDIGDTRYLVIKVEMIGKRSGKAMHMPEDQDKTKVEADFQIHSIKVLGDKPVDAKSLEQKAFDKVVADVKNGKYQ